MKNLFEKIGNFLEAAAVKIVGAPKAQVNVSGSALYSVKSTFYIHTPEIPAELK